MALHSLLAQGSAPEENGLKYLIYALFMLGWGALQWWRNRQEGEQQEAPPRPEPFREEQEEHYEREEDFYEEDESFEAPPPVITTASSTRRPPEIRQAPRLTPPPIPLRVHQPAPVAITRELHTGEDYHSSYSGDGDSLSLYDHESHPSISLEEIINDQRLTAEQRCIIMRELLNPPLALRERDII